MFGSDLIRRASEIYEKLDIERIAEAGIHRNIENYEFVTTYPPIRAHRPITQEDIFDGGNKARVVQFYIHIPFCTGKCAFCGRYLTISGASQEEVDNYINYLEKELELLISIPDLQSMRIGYMYIGGGTPTYLTSKQLSRLISKVRSSLSISDDSEFTVEGSPETVTEDKIKELLAGGVNRFSLGIQTYSDVVLKKSGRRHDSRKASETAKMVGQAGFNDFNIDLMTGLPLQSLESFEDSLQRSIDDGATSVTVYPLYVRPGCKMVGFDRRMFPTEKDSLMMQIMAKDFFEGRGFGGGPIHYFSRSKKECDAYQEAKWKGAENLGLGVSTYQFFDNTQYHNHFVLDDYKGAIDSGRLPVWVGIRLDREEQIARSIVLKIKGGGEVNKEDFISQFGVSPEEMYPETIAWLVGLDLIELTDAGIKLTYTGELYSEEVAIQFYTKDTRRAIGSSGYVGYSVAELPNF